MEQIKEKIEEIVEKLKNDDDLKARFLKEPTKVVEELLGIDLPDDAIEKIIDGVKMKIGADKLGSALGALKKLF